ncbi:MAG: PTS sugar transporter subunit IIA [Leptospiraceae bacterium]|jgi:PTS system fructose-specific IIA component/PTS system nitrogen regulatory IIA component|nr:PTS sugar transporter subunit IIA [Leptospiraceae bacterium]MCZ8347629.1 PTS sugar transporter subunit IIA [Leptospiraceae bacterium]PJE03933.1 MAG: PTS sugar transporter subunit IIA [Leptospira sp.]
MNHLLEILNESNVIFDFHADSKESVIQQMVDHLVNNHTLDSSKRNEVIESLLQREKSMSTGIGSGVAIPHCSISVVDTLKSVMAISPQGIAFDSIDSNPVHIFILLIVPKSKFQEHIKTLAMIAKTLNQPDEREKIIHSKSLEEIKKVLVVG